MNAKAMKIISSTGNYTSRPLPPGHVVRTSFAIASQNRPVTRNQQENPEAIVAKYFAPHLLLLSPTKLIRRNIPALLAICFISFFVMACATGKKNNATGNLPSLKEVFKNDFAIGTALSIRQI